MIYQSRSKRTSVRLDVEPDELVNVAVQVGFEIVCREAHEICVFSKMETESDGGRIRELLRIACGRAFRVGCAMAEAKAQSFTVRLRPD
jgi:hypothetical protein